MSNQFFILMGVAGCGKSSVGAHAATQLGWTLIEGDDHHSQSNRQKMHAGKPLDDADRATWLESLVSELRKSLADGHGAILTCSALKKSYRDIFRSAFPQAGFVFLDIPQSEAHSRVHARSAVHNFPASLVASQFDALESPRNEAGVLSLDASRPLEELCDSVVMWASKT